MLLIFSHVYFQDVFQMYNWTHSAIIISQPMMCSVTQVKCFTTRKLETSNKSSIWSSAHSYKLLVTDIIFVEDISMMSLKCYSAKPFHFKCRKSEMVGSLKCCESIILYSVHNETQPKLLYVWWFSSHRTNIIKRI